MSDDIVDRLRKSASAIHIAVEPEVAQDVAAIMTDAAAEIEELRHYVVLMEVTFLSDPENVDALRKQAAVDRETKKMDDEQDNFHGHRNQDRHRTLGPHRASCECGVYCYPRIEAACYCCKEQMADEDPCPHCEGTGINPNPEYEPELA